MSTELPPRSTDEDFNPYAPPVAAIGEEPADLITGDDAEAEAIRRAHISHEASIKSLGSLHYLGAIVTLIASGGLVFNALSNQTGNGPEQTVFTFGMVFIYFLQSGLHLALGIGLHRLRNWARWIDVVLTSLSLLGIAVLVAVAAVMGILPLLLTMGVAALISAYVLYLLVSPKAKTIFSPDYQEIIARTPHIKYRTSLVVKIFLGILLAVFALAIVGAIIGSSRVN
jgi:hypothetical protein